KPFEDAMQNVAGLFQMMVQNIKAENKEKAKLGHPLTKMPETVGDAIWHISFTMYARQTNGGPFFLGMKDFKVMTEEDRADFGKIIADIQARREANQLQTQEASEAEEEVAGLTEAPAAEVVSVQTNAVAEANAKIQI